MFSLHWEKLICPSWTPKQEYFCLWPLVLAFSLSKFRFTWINISCFWFHSSDSRKLSHYEIAIVKHSELKLQNSVLSLQRPQRLCGKVKQKRDCLVKGDQIPRSLGSTSRTSNLSQDKIRASEKGKLQLSNSNQQKKYCTCLEKKSSFQISATSIRMRISVMNVSNHWQPEARSRQMGKNHPEPEISWNLLHFSDLVHVGSAEPCVFWTCPSTGKWRRAPLTHLYVFTVAAVINQEFCNFMLL